MPESMKSEEIVFRHDGGEPMNFIDGWFISAIYRGEQVLLYTEKFLHLKRMQHSGEEIRITLPKTLPGLCWLETLAVMGAIVLDEQGRRLNRGFREVPGLRYHLHEITAFSIQLFQASEGPGSAVRARKERRPDPATMERDAKIYRLANDDQFSWSEIKVRLEAEGTYLSIEGIRSAYARHEARSRPGAN